MLRASVAIEYMLIGMGPCLSVPAAGIRLRSYDTGTRSTFESHAKLHRELDHSPALSPSTHARTSPHRIGGRQEGGSFSHTMSLPTAAAANHQFTSLAKTLPEKLQRFLARYPPPQLFGVGAPRSQTGHQADSRNPFRPKRHPATGRWHNPVYSARRQADLVKLARAHGVEELLPHTEKKTEVRLARKVEFGSRVKGTGVGQKVKGRIHERQLAVKYVPIPARDGGGAAGVSRCACWTLADFAVQDGQEERGHAQDAGAHQGVEGGRFDVAILFAFRDSAKRQYRLEGKTGPGGRNEGLLSHDGLSLTAQICVAHAHQHKNTRVEYTALPKQAPEVLFRCPSIPHVKIVEPSVGTHDGCRIIFHPCSVNYLTPAWEGCSIAITS